MRSKFPPPGQERDQLIKDYQDCPAETITEFCILKASQYGFKNSTSFQNKMWQTLGVRRKVPASKKKLYNDPPIIRTDGLLVLSDIHIPFHDAIFINNCLDLANAWGIPKGVNNGDFLNMTAFSIFIHKPHDKIWAEERDTAILAMRAMADAVPDWLLLLGNHEAFLIKQLAEQLKADDILALLGNQQGFKATDYYYCKAVIGEGKQGEWRISHPRNIATIHGRVAARLANKCETNVISGHGHLFGVVPSENDRFIAIDSGVCCEPLALDYAVQRDTLRPTMCKAATILIKGDDGKCHYYPLRPDSDWQALRRLYQK